MDWCRVAYDFRKKWKNGKEDHKTDGTLDSFSNSDILSSNCKVCAISSKPSKRIFFLYGSISNDISSEILQNEET